MIAFDYTITDAAGIHARPAGLLAKEASKCKSRVTLHFDGRQADARRLIAVMHMGVRHGSTVHVEVEGADEAQAAERLRAFFAAHL